MTKLHFHATPRLGPSGCLTLLKGNLARNYSAGPLLAPGDKQLSLGLVEGPRMWVDAVLVTVRVVDARRREQLVKVRPRSL